MKPQTKITISLLILGLVGIQFIPTKRNRKSVVNDQDFSSVYQVPKNITKLLSSSCYNCHSNQTNYPWYANIQPVGWLLQYHIDKGKKELNFSTFGQLSSRMKNLKIKSMKSQIEDSKMPISSYLYLHPEADLSESEKGELIAYLDSLSAQNAIKD
ncbi:MAG: heme-binding domain-containing protein [Cytophagales bacterium]|nr:heme-binding domain-containing protein [Cytophagales bacterium]